MTEKQRLQDIIYKAKEEQAALAVLRYDEKYNNGLYVKAITGRPTRYANALIDEAMAFCGHPWYSFSNRMWSIKALLFLAEFTK